MTLSEPATHPWKKLGSVFRGRFACLSLSIVLLLALHPVLEPVALKGIAAVELFYWAILLSVIRAVSGRRPPVRTLAYVLAGLNASAQVAGLLLPAAWIAWTELATEMLLYGFMAVLILGHVFGAGRVDSDRLLGAVCVYFFIGLIWGDAYALIEHLQPGSFLLPGPASDPFPALLYFSYTTLTTLGYGDVVPLSPLTRMLAALEAVAGQLYVTVLVARLVGLHLAQSPRLSAAAD